MNPITPASDLASLAKDRAASALERCRWREDPPPLLFVMNHHGQVSAEAAHGLAGPESLKEAVAARLLASIAERRIAEMAFSAAAWSAPLTAGQAGSAVPLAPAPSAHPGRVEVITVAHWTPTCHELHCAAIYRRRGKAPQPGEWRLASRQTGPRPGLQPLLGWNIVEALRTSAAGRQSSHRQARRAA